MKTRFIISSLLFLVILHPLNAQKVAFFDNIEFDSSTAIIALPSVTNPGQNKHLAFIINTEKDFNRLKEDWVFEEKDFGKKPDNSLAIYRVKNKVGEWIGTIYPGIGKLTSVRASYVFDTLKLVAVAKKHPFNYRVKRETFKNRIEYLNRYNQAILEKNYLFSFGPGSWDGTFKITIPSSDSIHTPVAAMDMLTSKLSAITAPANYSLRYELTEDNRDYNKSFNITVDCIQLVYDRYNDSVYVKFGWKPEPMFMTSLWKGIFSSSVQAH